MQTGKMHIKAVVFDLESTLVQTGNNDPTTIIKPTTLPDAEDVIGYLRSKNIRLAVFSRGNLASVEKILADLSPSGISGFDAIVCRQQLQPDSTGSDAIDLAAKKMKLSPRQIMAVAADPAFLQEGATAGAFTVHFAPDAALQTIDFDFTFQISRLSELKNIVRQGIPLPSGKLPNDLLREYLNQFVFDDPSILVNPGVGEDTAAVDVTPEEVLVLKSDPITFATDSIGQYAVLINANDIATSGAIPRWLLTTLLFPCGVTPYEIRQVINELKKFCRQWGITLCGGHTEITDAVTRPVVTGMMAGTVARRNLIDKRNMASGDCVLLTKGVAVEGTAIIAREFGGRLRNLGMAESAIETARQFLASISIIPEARIAASSQMVSAMHDVTEGGLATAAEELSIAGGYRIEIDVDSIPVFTETGKMCRLLGIHPLGLIGSGSLLICCRQESCEKLMKEIREAGIEVRCIGKVLEKGQGISAVEKNRPTPWPQFEVDEITRLF